MNPTENLDWFDEIDIPYKFDFSLSCVGSTRKLCLTLNLFYRKADMLEKSLLQLRGIFKCKSICVLHGTILQENA